MSRLKGSNLSLGTKAALFIEYHSEYGLIKELRISVLINLIQASGKEEIVVRALHTQNSTQSHNQIESAYTCMLVFYHFCWGHCSQGPVAFSKWSSVSSPHLTYTVAVLSRAFLSPEGEIDSMVAQESRVG